MMVTINNGNPLLPLEHIHHATCVSGTIWDEKESKHPDASFFFTSTPPGTECYGGNPVVQSNGSRNSDHGPQPLHQLRLHLWLEMACDNSNDSPLYSTHTINIKNTKYKNKPCNNIQ